MWTIIAGNGYFADAANPVTTNFTEFNEIQIYFASCIPTVSIWGIIVSSLLLITMSLVAIRNRKLLLS